MCMTWLATVWRLPCWACSKPVSMAKAIAAQTRQKLDMNQQCLSEGLANFTGSFFQCFPRLGLVNPFDD